MKTAIKQLWFLGNQFVSKQDCAGLGTVFISQTQPQIMAGSYSLL